MDLDQDWQEVILSAHSGDYDGEDLSLAGYEKAALLAQASGFEIVIRKPNQLLLDLDSPLDVANYLEQVIRMEALVKKEVSRWPSKSARYDGDGHLHVIIELWAEVTEVEAIALQAMLSSDPMREYLNLIRYRNGVKNPTRLFKPPEPKRTYMADGVVKLEFHKNIFSEL